MVSVLRVIYKENAISLYGIFYYKDVHESGCINVIYHPELSMTVMIYPMDLGVGGSGSGVCVITRI